MDHPTSLSTAIRAADARDRDLARGAMQQLTQAGRIGHPAVPHLDHVITRDGGDDDDVFCAAVAFEAAARLHLVKRVGAAMEEGRRPAEVAPFLFERPPSGWEEPSNVPYTEVRWRDVIAAAADNLRQGLFEMPMFLPGAHLFSALQANAADTDSFVQAILGPSERDDSLDPVATSGHFLASAMPGYVDLDRLLRQQREALMAAQRVES